MLWWSPDPRAVLFPGEFRVSRSLREDPAQSRFRNQRGPRFAEVVARCADAAPAPRGHLDLARNAVGLSASCTGSATRTPSRPGWTGELVGGLYGVALGRVFFGESMFSVERDASKVALKRLVDEAVARGIGLIDCQMRART